LLFSATEGKLRLSENPFRRWCLEWENIERF